jgi:hypothetical protein
MTLIKKRKKKSVLKCFQTEYLDKHEIFDELEKAFQVRVQIHDFCSKSNASVYIIFLYQLQTGRPM